jgi:hypothetical protein
MKKIRTIVAILFISLMAVGMTSCEVGRHTDDGRHRGLKHDEEHRDGDHHDRGGVIIVDPVRRDNDHHDHD